MIVLLEDGKVGLAPAPKGKDILLRPFARTNAPYLIPSLLALLGPEWQEIFLQDDVKNQSGGQYALLKSEDGMPLLVLRLDPDGPEADLEGLLRRLTIPVDENAGFNDLEGHRVALHRLKTTSGLGSEFLALRSAYPSLRLISMRNDTSIDFPELTHWTGSPGRTALMKFNSGLEPGKFGSLRTQMEIMIRDIAPWHTFERLLTGKNSRRIGFTPFPAHIPQGHLWKNYINRGQSQVPSTYRLYEGVGTNTFFYVARERVEDVFQRHFFLDQSFWDLLGKIRPLGTRVDILIETDPSAMSVSMDAISSETNRIVCHVPLILSPNQVADFKTSLLARVSETRKLAPRIEPKETVHRNEMIGRAAYAMPVIGVGGTTVKYGIVLLNAGEQILGLLDEDIYQQAAGDSGDDLTRIKTHRLSKLDDTKNPTVSPQEFVDGVCEGLGKFLDSRMEGILSVNREIQVYPRVGISMLSSFTGPGRIVLGPGNNKVFKIEKSAVGTEIDLRRLYEDGLERT